MKSFASIHVARDADDVETCVFFFAFCFGLLSPSYQGAPRPPSGICPSAAACVLAGVSKPDVYYCVIKKKFHDNKEKKTKKKQKHTPIRSMVRQEQHPLS